MNSQYPYPGKQCLPCHAQIGQLTRRLAWLAMVMLPCLSNATPPSQLPIEPGSPAISETTTLPLTHTFQLDQRLDRLQQQVHRLSRQHLEEKIEKLNQQISDLRTLVELEGQELLAVNQRLQKLEARQIPLAASSNPSPLSTPSNAKLSPLNATTTPINPHQILPPDNPINLQASADFQNAIQFVRQKRYSIAIPTLQKFIHDYPDNAHTPSAYYWLGRSEAIAGNTNMAISAYTTLINQYPKSVRRPDALSYLAELELDRGNIAATKKWLETILTDYPDSSAAVNAKKRLRTISGL